jgi:SHS2 domain-containing protein
MEKFRFLEHTADVKYEAFGKTLAEAFENAAVVVHKVVTQDKVKPVIEKKIKVKSKTKRALLYDFIEEIVFLMDTKHMLVCEAKVKIREKNNNFELEAILKGDNCRSYECHGDIKSMTYSDLAIEEKRGSVKLTIVLDI